MSKLNPNAGEFVPSFSAPAIAVPSATSPAPGAKTPKAAAPLPAKTPKKATAAAAAATSGAVTTAPPTKKANKPTPIVTTASLTSTSSSNAATNATTTTPPTPALATPAAAATAKTNAPTATATTAAATPTPTPTVPQTPSMEDPPSPEDAESGDRLVYAIEYLRLFQPICDAVPCRFPDVVRAPPPQKLGRYLHDRLVYTVPELLQFQPLYRMPPPNFTWTETLATPEAADKKAKTPAKSKKEKAKQKAAAAAAAGGGAQQLQYDPMLMCYFNPTEYAAALNMAAYGSSSGGAVPGVNPSVPATGAPSDHTSQDALTALGGSKASGFATNVVEEGIAAKRRLASVLDDVRVETIPSALKQFEEIPITCNETLQDVIGILFDRAIAEPERSDAYAHLCSGMAERTPEFKEGAKTINFRRILLTKCYEALVEEPDVVGPVHAATTKANGTVAPTSSPHSWRRQCMLRNVGLIGELFRRQLLTENIMHVCVAMMLEDEVHPEPEVIKAACQLLDLVGDLLDGSSPASRRTMDEYFDVLQRLREHLEAPEGLKAAITELASVRAGGWAKKRLEPSSSAPPASAPSPAKGQSVTNPIQERRSPSARGQSTTARDVDGPTETARS